MFAWLISGNALTLVQKYINTSPENNLDVVDSETYVVRVLIGVLTFHWNASIEQRSLDLEEVQETPPAIPPKHSDESLRSNQTNFLDDPPALDDNVAKYALVAMITFIRRCGPTKADNVRANDRVDSLDMLHEADKFDMDMAVLHATRPFPLRADLSLNVNKGTSQESGSERQPATQSISSVPANSGTMNVAMYIPSALAVRSSAQTAIAPMTVTHLYGSICLYS